jgi:hypothetical protein
MDCIEPSVLLKFKSIKSYHKVNNWIWSLSASPKFQPPVPQQFNLTSSIRRWTATSARFPKRTILKQELLEVWELYSYELIRLLLNHQHATIDFAQSTS